jgi:hypothetical protein
LARDDKFGHTRDIGNAWVRHPESLDDKVARTRGYKFVKAVRRLGGSVGAVGVARPRPGIGWIELVADAVAIVGGIGLRRGRRRRWVRLLGFVVWPRSELFVEA